MLWALPILALFGSWPAEAIKGHPRHGFSPAAQKAIERCKEVLRRRLPPEEIRRQILRQAGLGDARGFEEVPELIPVGHLAGSNTIPHEVHMATLYSRVIRAEAGESLVFLPRLSGVSVPAYDGIVLDRRLLPIANVSFKWVIGGRAKSGVSRALSAIKRFSAREEWFSLMGFYGHQGLEVQNKRVYNRRFLRDPEFYTHLDWADHAFSWFGVDVAPARPTRIVVALSDESAAAQDVERVLAQVRSLGALAQSRDVSEVRVLWNGDPGDVRITPADVAISPIER